MTSPSHPSPLALERLALSELRGADEGAVRLHVAGCELCRRRLLAMDGEAARYSRSPHSSPARQRFARAERTWRRNAMLAALAPAVAVAAVLVAWPWSSRPAPAPVVAAKDPAPSVRPTPPPRHGREVIELRPGSAPPRLRALSLRGQEVALGQGVLEAASDSGPARPFVLERTRVSADVTGFVSAVTVTQEFRNPFSTPVEAVYVFPLPDDAAVDELTLTAGSRVIRATIQKRETARRMYEEAKAQGRRAALLDQERPNLFTQSVANLLPGEKVQVTLRYVAPLRYDDGAFTFNFPMTVAPRYVPGDAVPGESQGTGTHPDTTRVLDASRITPPAQRTGRDISVEVRLDAGAPIEALWSTSHRLVADRPSTARAVLTLDPADRIPNKDLVLRFSVAGPQKRAAVLATGGRGGAFALMLNPEAQVTDAAVTPKELVFVIDTSCSMSGPPLAAAKRAMTQAMQQANPRDTFMLIDFADRASSFHDTPLPATDANVRRALSYLSALPSSGGTNQLSGIRRALGRPEDPERLRVVLLMTDGLIGDEHEVFAEAHRLLGHARVFGFGIGNSVNHFLLSRLSEVGRGFYQYVRTDEDPGPAVERFVRRIARPLMTDVEVDWGGLQVADVLPRRVPDLFDAQPLILLGRNREPGTGVVTLRGKVAGRPVSFSTPVTFPGEATGGAGLTTLWARARVEELDRQQHWGETADAARDITTLGLEYHLVTAYTSLVAVEATPVTRSGASRTVTVPTEQADGMEVDGRDDARRTHGPPPVADPLPSGDLELRNGAATVPVKVPPGRYRVSLSTGTTEAGEGDRGGQAIDATTVLPPPLPKAGDDGEADDFTKAFGSDRHTKRPEATPKSAYIPPPMGRANDVMGSLDRSAIQRVILSHRDALKACFDAERKVDATLLQGKWVLEWTIRPDGTVARVRVKTGQPGRQRFEACLVRVVEGLRFPSVGGDVVVSYPFLFQGGE